MAKKKEKQEKVEKEKRKYKSCIKWRKKTLKSLLKRWKCKKRNKRWGKFYKVEYLAGKTSIKRKRKEESKEKNWELSFGREKADRE